MSDPATNATKPSLWKTILPFNEERDTTLQAIPSQCGYNNITTTGPKEQHRERDGVNLRTNLSAARRPQVKTPDVLSALIQSLSFDGIWDCHSEIVAAHPGTCEWILPCLDKAPATGTQKDEARAQNQAAFSTWLESDDDFFWIRGTAGSGKSTLVNHIIRNEANIRHRLRAWAGMQDVIFASFFSWRHGKFLQKSIHGMLRALLIQVLQQAPLAIDALILELPAYQQKWLLNPSTTLDRPWSRAHLLGLLRKAINCSQNKICFFIDALDEFQAHNGQDQLNPHEVTLKEDVYNLLEVIKGLRELPNVRICVASRPANFFDLAFASTQFLDLERLNKDDIRVYINAKLGLRLMKNLADDLSTFLINRSEGISLWVRLAVGSLLEGAANGDIFEELETSLNELPASLESMYGHTLRRLAPRYRDDATLLFSLCSCLTHHLRHCSTPNAMLIFMCRGSQAKNFDRQAHTLSPMYMAKTLISRSCGLLRLATDVYHQARFKGLGWERSKELEALASLNMSFIHRTAQDYALKHIVDCNHKPKSNHNGVRDALTIYIVAVIAGSILYLRLLYGPYTGQMQDRHFLQMKRLGGRDNFPFSGRQVYFLCLTLLSNMQQSLISVSGTHEYLDRLSAIPLILVDPALFTRFGMNDVYAPEVCTWLSHASHFDNHGFKEHVLAKMRESGPYKAAVVSYLLYFALLWSAQTRVTDSCHENWELELQCMLERLQRGSLYLRHIWRVSLVEQPADLASRYFPIPIPCYAMLPKAYKCIDIAPFEPLRLHLTTPSGFNYNRGIWEVAVYPGLLLHPSIAQVSCYDHPNNRSEQLTNYCVNLYDQELPAQGGPRYFHFIDYHDCWLKLQRVLKEDELDWEEWYNILVSRYGLRERCRRGL